MVQEIKEHTFFDDYFRKEINVVDLGACRGEFINEINSLYSVKKAILVEANPTNFSQLKDLPNYVLYNKAISSKDNETIEFFEDPTSPYNGSKDFNYFNGIKHSIKTISLETLCKENNIDFIDILKIDIEGAEYDILENTPDSFFDKIGQITVEFHDFVDPELKPRTIEIVKRMNNLGFSHIAKPINHMYGSDYYDVLFYRPKNIGIIYICTGKYIQFLEDFLSTAEVNFLPNHRKEYFIFTDSQLDNPDSNKFHIIYQEKLGWPYDTLNRFHMINGISSQVDHIDYMYFCNANLLINEPIDETILPNHETKMIGVNHPGQYMLPNTEFTYERNPNSLAYIPLGEGKYYYQGCFFGGTKDAFLEMSKQLQKDIDEDLSNDIIAIWHDESHLNKYFLNNSPKLLDPSYANPEAFYIPFPKRITQIDKNKLGGHDFLRS
jgi:FkbM family methyltransferase